MASPLACKSFPPSDCWLSAVTGRRSNCRPWSGEFARLVVTGGYKLSSGLMQLAEARGVSVINSPYDTATTTMRIKAAQMIESVIDTSFMTIPGRMPVATARQQVFRSPQTIFPVVDGSRLVGVLSKSDLVNPPQARNCLGGPQRTIAGRAGCRGRGHRRSARPSSARWLAEVESSDSLLHGAGWIDLHARRTNVPISQDRSVSGNRPLHGVGNDQRHVVSSFADRDRHRSRTAVPGCSNSVTWI